MAGGKVIYHEQVSTKITHFRPLAGPQETRAEQDEAVLPTLATTGQNDTELTPKPRRKRKRKDNPADKFIIVRVNQDLYDKVQGGAAMSGEKLSVWVRKALMAQLS